MLEAVIGPPWGRCDRDGNWICISPSAHRSRVGPSHHHRIDPVGHFVAASRWKHWCDPPRTGREPCDEHHQTAYRITLRCHEAVLARLLLRPCRIHHGICLVGLCRCSDVSGHEKERSYHENEQAGLRPWCLVPHDHQGQLGGLGRRVGFRGPGHAHGDLRRRIVFSNA